MDGFRRSAKWKGSGLMALMALMLTACAQQADFGRDTPTAFDRLEEKTLTYLGEGHEVSLPLTSAERDLRAMSSDFATGSVASRKGAFAAMTAWVEAQVTEPTPASLAYYEALSNRHRASPVSLVNALGDDIAVDNARMDMIAPVCDEVIAGDRSRADELLGAEHTRAVLDYEGPGAFAKAQARIGENDVLIDKTVNALASRLVGYRVALAHAQLDAPVEDRLVMVEKALSDMEAHVEIMAASALRHAAIMDALKAGASA